MAVSPASVYRVLRQAGVLDRWNRKPSPKGTGFVQPLRPRQHWHVDVSHLNICGTFYFMCSILDGGSVRTSPYYPQSNGKIERCHRTIKGACIRVTTLWSLDDARRAVAEYVRHDNEVRLHRAIGYVTPMTKLAGKEKELH